MDKLETKTPEIVEEQGAEKDTEQEKLISEQNENSRREAAKDFVMSYYNAYKNREGLETKWDENDKLYNNISIEKYYDQGFANLFSPEIRQAINTVENFIDEALNSADPNFKIKGNGGKSDQAKAEIHQKTIYWQMNKMKFRSKNRKGIHTLLTHGFVVFKETWCIKERTIIEYDKKLGMKKPLNSLAYDNLDWQVPNIRNMYFDYFCEDYQELPIIIERIDNVTWEHLKANEKRTIVNQDSSVKEIGIYENLSVIESEMILGKGNGSSGVTDNSEHKNYLSELTGLGDSFRDIKGQQRFTLLEAWCNYDLDGDGLAEECVITIVNDKWVIRLSPNPTDIKLKPYIMHSWDEIDGMCIGMGIPQVGKKSQIALNDFLNQVMDNITQIINNAKIVDVAAEISDFDLKSRPNQIIKSKMGVDAVRFMEKPNTVPEGLQAIAMMKDEIRSISRATMSMQGLPAKYGTTATEYSQQYASSARDLFSKLRAFEDNVLKEFLYRAYSLDMQFLSRADYIKIVGEDVLKTNLGIKDIAAWKVEDLMIDADFIPLGLSQMENKVVQAQQQINFFNLVAKVPGLAKLDKLAKIIWKNLNNNRGDEDIINEQPEPQLISPEDENILMQQGESINPKVQDNHLYHLKVHQQLQNLPNVLIHMQRHMQIMQLLQQQQGSGGGIVNPNEQPNQGPNIPTENKIVGEAGQNGTGV